MNGICPSCGGTVGEYCTCNDLPPYQDYGPDPDDFLPEPDEYFEDDDNYPFLDSDDRDDGEPDEMSYHTYLRKALNGHLVFVNVALGRYRGEDWGEASYSHTSYTRLSELDTNIKLHRAAAIEQGREIQPGSAADYKWPHCLSNDGRVLYADPWGDPSDSETCAECAE